MTWWEVVIYLWLVTAVLVAVYYTGRNIQRHDEKSREEAIRAQAYQDGRQSVIDERIERMSMKAPEQFLDYHVTTYKQPKNHRTKESS